MSNGYADIPMEKGFFYLLAILDLRSRYVLHWQLSNTLEADGCVDAFKETLNKWGKPLIFNRAGGPDRSGQPVYQR